MHGLIGSRENREPDLIGDERTPMLSNSRGGLSDQLLDFSSSYAEQRATYLEAIVPEATPSRLRKSRHMHDAAKRLSLGN